MEWDITHVQNNLMVRLYCSASVQHPNGETRTYWATERRYPYNGGCRRDMVQIDLGRGKVGMAQLVSFVDLTHLPRHDTRACAKVVLIRWLSPSCRSTNRDDKDRPLCPYPLSSNHCLRQWSDAGRNRLCFSRRGFRRKVDRQKMWGHVPLRLRSNAIQSEKRARYDVIQYDSIFCHANVAEDPSTGHMLQTLQMI